MRRRVSTPGDEKLLLEGVVAGGVVGDAVLPAAPQDARPGASDGSDRALVVVSAGASVAVEAVCPGVVVAGAVGEGAERVAEAVVAGAAEAGDLLLAGLDRDGRLAGVASERFAGGVAGALIADLGEQDGGGESAVGAREGGEEDLPVRMCVDRVGDLAIEQRDLLDDRAQDGDQSADELAARRVFALAGAAGRRGPELLEQLSGWAPAAVAVAREEVSELPFSHPARVGGGGPALQERERDLPVQARERKDRSRPAALQFGAQLVDQRPASAHQLASSARQRPQRLGLIAVGDQHPKPAVIGTRELGEHERVETIGLG